MLRWMGELGCYQSLGNLPEVYGRARRVILEDWVV